MISDAEKERRRRAVGSSEGSLAIEGQSLDAFTRDLNKRYIDGEISLDEFSRAIDDHVASLAESMRGETLAATA